MEDYRGDHFIFRYSYDTDGQLSSILCKWEEGTPFFYRYCNYNADGCLTTELYVDQWTSFELTTYEYDELGRCIREATAYLEWEEEDVSAWWGEFWNDVWSNAHERRDRLIVMALGMPVGRTNRIEYTYY